MTYKATSETPERPSGDRRWRRRLVSILMLLLVIGITVGIFVATRRYPDLITRFGSYGYLGFFLVSLISSMSVVLPVPGVILIFPLIIYLNPILLAVAGSTGGIIGEITGYAAGLSGRGIVAGGKWQGRVEQLFKRWGGWTIFAFAAIPLMPFDIAGLVAGAFRYPLWRFLVIGWVGKTIKFIILMYAALFGWSFILDFIG